MSAHILVIEDNSANLELMRYLLDSFQHRVSVASSGESGIISAQLEAPDLVLCDLSLPGIDGYEVVHRMRANMLFDKIPIIAVTGQTSAGERERGLTLFDGFIAKPIDPATFVLQVESFLSTGLRGAAPANGMRHAAVAPNGRSILVIDDRVSNLDAARSTLGKAGYRVLTVTRPLEAIQLARVAVPDVVLSDVRMPVGTGYDLIREFKADLLLHDIPFVFITAAASENERRAGFALGAAKYLFSPLSAEELVREIDSCFDPAQS
jgi:two-component system, cell cycle response regulator